MFDSSWSRTHPWFWGFVLGCASSVIGLLAIIVAVAAGDTNGGRAEPLPDLPTPTTAPAESPTATISADEPLTYVGRAPARAEELGLVEVEGDDRPDLEFDPNDPGGVVTNVDVLVTDPAMGVFDVSLEQAEALAAGRVANWSEVGGRDLAVTVATVGAVGESSQIARLESFETYDDLRAALISGSGIVALVPTDEVRSPMNSIAIGGVDPVRGDDVGDDWPFVERTGIKPVSDRGSEQLLTVVEGLRWVPPTAIRVVGTGDTIPVRCSLAAIEATGDYGAPFRGEVGQYLAAADIALGSLDTSLQDFSEPYRCIDTVNLTSPSASVEMLVAAGFEGVNVATNHVFDCGEVGACGSDAFLSTLDVLTEAGIAYIGGGRDLEEALSPSIFEAEGISIGVLGFDDVGPVVFRAGPDEVGTSPLDDSYEDEVAAGSGEAPFFASADMLELERFSERIAELKAREDVDFVAILLNSGTENTHDPSPRSIKAARAAIEAGADIVFGNQAHHVQASESIDDGFIIYAMGNFVYDQVHSPEFTEGVMTEVVFWPDRMASVRLIPVAIRDYYLPEFQDPAARGGKILNDVSGAAQALAD